MVGVALAPVLRTHLSQLACRVLSRLTSVGQGVRGDKSFLAKAKQTHAGDGQHRASALGHDVSASRTEHAGECSPGLGQLTLIAQHVLQQRLTLSLLALQVRGLGTLTSLNGLFIELGDRVIASVDVGSNPLGDASSALQQTNTGVGNGLAKGAINLIGRRGSHGLRAAWLLTLFLRVVPA